MESFFRSNFVRKRQQYVRRQTTEQHVCGKSNIPIVKVLIGQHLKFRVIEFCRAFTRRGFLVRSFSIRALLPSVKIRPSVDGPFKRVKK